MPSTKKAASSTKRKSATGAPKKSSARRKTTRSKTNAAHEPSHAKGSKGAAEDAPRTGPRAMWSGTLSFGLVTVPVELYSATHSTRRSLRMLAPDGTPLARRYFSSGGEMLESDDLERGYELDVGSFVVVEDEELERLLPEQSRDIDLTRFVDRSAIPALYFDKAYILAPAQDTHSAYRLLASTMERLDKAGIATFVMRERQYLVAITARDGVLRAETLRFQDELRTPTSLGLPTGDVDEARVKRLKAAVSELSKATVSERELQDTYWKRVEKLVADKQKKHKDVVPAETEQEGESAGAEVIDLMAILRQSLANQKSPAHKSAPHKSPGLQKTRHGDARKTRAGS